MIALEFPGADDPYFGDAMVLTSRFLAWLDERGLALPADVQLQQYRFLQVAALLNEIWSDVLGGVPLEKAHARALKDPEYPKNAYKPAARVYVSSQVRNQWRTLLIEAVSAGELILLDYASKLPLPPPEPSILEEDLSDDRKRYEWEQRARAFAVEICVQDITKGNKPSKQDVAANEVVVLLKNAEIKTVKGKEISLDYVMKALQPWTAPEEARKIIDAEKEKKKITGK